MRKEIIQYILLLVIAVPVHAIGGKGCPIPFRVEKCRRNDQSVVRCLACFTKLNDGNERCVQYSNFSTTLDQLPKDIHQLRFKRVCRAEEIPPSTFSAFKHLRKLSLWLCGLKKNITEKAFEGLADLEDLELEFSANFKYYKVEDSTFRRMVKLKRLTLVPHKKDKHKHGPVNVEETLNSLPQLEEFTLSTQFLPRLDLQRLPPRPSLKVLNLTNNFLKDMPTIPCFPNLRYLILSCNEIKKVNLSSKGLLPTPEIHIDLRNSRIQLKIEEQDFKSYANIRNLSLDVSGSIKEVQQNAFRFFTEQSSTSLQNLTFGGQVHGKLSFDSQRYLLADLANSTIERLHMWGPALVVSSRHFFELLQIPTLQKFLLTDCSIQTLQSDSLEGVPNLVYLDLTKGNVRTIDDKVFDGLTKLETLILNDNALNPKSMKNILEFLDSKRDPNIKRLEMRNVEGLAHQKMLPVVLNAYHLHSLDLSGNNIGHSKLRIKSGNYLQQLYLNDVRSATEKCITLDTMPKLASLEIAHCESCVDALVTQLTRQKLQLPNLRYLDISRNSVEHVKWSHMNIGNLEGLNLSETGIVNASRLPQLKKLTWLNLQGNNITTINANAFSKLPSLEDINLQMNAIVYIDSNAFSHQRNLSTLKLDNNNFDCNCKLRAFRDWLQNKSRLNIALVGKCSLPVDLENVYIDEYELGWLSCDGHMILVVALSSAVFILAIVLAVIVYRKYFRRRGYEEIRNPIHSAGGVNGE